MSTADRLAATAARMLIVHHRMVAEGQGHYGLGHGYGHGLGGGSALWEELERDLSAFREEQRLVQRPTPLPRCQTTSLAMPPEACTSFEGHAGPCSFTYRAPTELPGEGEVKR
jgi:hypothetical protein